MEKSTSKEQAIARRVAAERKAAGTQRVRFSVELRRDAAALAAASARSRGEVATTLGLGRTLLQSWVMAEHGPVRRKRGAAKKPGRRKPMLQRVAITATTGAADGSLELVFPSGARLPGLTLKQLRTLLGVSQ